MAQGSVFEPNPTSRNISCLWAASQSPHEVGSTLGKDNKFMNSGNEYILPQCALRKVKVMLAFPVFQAKCDTPHSVRRAVSSQTSGQDSEDEDGAMEMGASTVEREERIIDRLARMEEREAEMEIERYRRKEKKRSGGIDAKGVANRCYRLLTFFPFLSPSV
ncbi:hypothetical protein B0H10DRAFT_1956318 [Mycena sp. CBHHK59/15]|nr:hypothetical protein B0H10DRAFT_1956318 [Mycena sp. CBHHK59/15]